MKNAIIGIACDGACSANGTLGAVGGWGVYAAAGEDTLTFSGGKRGTTNNEMELTAMLASLYLLHTLFFRDTPPPAPFRELYETLREQCSEQDTVFARIDDALFRSGNAAPKKAVIYSDSAYIVNCFADKWYVGWEKNGWKNASGQKVKNRELWEEILKLRHALSERGIPVDIVKIKGHLSEAEAENWYTRYKSQYTDRDEFQLACQLNRTADRLATAAARRQAGDGADAK